jgi:hypothetical protein
MKAQAVKDLEQRTLEQAIEVIQHAHRLAGR